MTNLYYISFLQELEAAFVSTEERILFHDLHCKLLRGLYEHDTNTQNAIT